MNEVISENKKTATSKKRRQHKPAPTKLVEQAIAPAKKEARPIAASFFPQNWKMSTDAMVKLLPDVEYVEESLVVKNTGLKSYTNEPIGESTTEDKIVKSSVRFGYVIDPGKSANLHYGDIIAINMIQAKIIDFDKNFAVVPHFAIYGTVENGKGPQPETKPTRTNLFGRIFKGWNWRLGIRDVLKRK